MMTDIDHLLFDYTRHKDLNEDYSSDVDSNSSVNSNGTNEQTVDETSSVQSEGSSENHNRNVFNDTPMSLLSNSGSPSIENLDYATTVTYDDGNASTENESSSESSSETKGKTSSTSKSVTNSERNDNRNKIEDIYGRNRSVASIFEEFDDKFVDVDVLVIRDLEDLFFKLW